MSGPENWRASISKRCNNQECHADVGEAIHLGEPENSIRRCELAITRLEKRLWENGCDAESLKEYQAAHRQMEEVRTRLENDSRHKIVVVVSVADRPQLLRNCLDSLVRLCELFQYGGMREGRYPKVAVLIADDSRNEDCRRLDREVARACEEKGVEVHYWGIEEQLQWADTLPSDEWKKFQRILGDLPRESFYHKGASVMRNLSYLKLRELGRGTDEPLLFHFIDSDQEFCIRALTEDGERDLYAISYFHALNRIFSTTDTMVLTGKVVGDPPVSPSVMMSGFLEDVIAFIQSVSETAPEEECLFHAGRSAREEGGGAIYHDMREMFGFSKDDRAYGYSCNLLGHHTNRACFEYFAGGLDRFFHGEHPTRQTHYGYAGPELAVAPARTVYSGNYVIRPEGLRYFLPFASLRLRMPGPTLGRLLKPELGRRFVAANLPMLHRRTGGGRGEVGFRPGVDRAMHSVDISGEFVRQFYGDVILFSIEKLTGLGYPQIACQATIFEVIDETRQKLLEDYNERREKIRSKLEQLSSCIDNPRAWWNAADEPNQSVDARGRLKVFVANVVRNFGGSSQGYAIINSADQWQRRRAELATTVGAYQDDRDAWESLLFGKNTGAARAG